jgi:protein tyrosine phosphatase (PTP) superfamily phosphohydrolase (DUF442 family)
MCVALKWPFNCEYRQLDTQFFKDFSMAPIKFTSTKLSPPLPVIEKVCFKVTGDKRTFYVTSQPVYLWPGTSPYQAVAQAGITALVSVRDSSEYTIPFNPFDLTETDQLILNSVAYSNIPLPHIAMSQALFDQQAFHVARTLHEWKGPILIHCSSGDRASAGFAAMLITYYGYSNKEAVHFATKKLALQNPQFVAWVTAYKPPK